MPKSPGRHRVHPAATAAPVPVPYVPVAQGAQSAGTVSPTPVWYVPAAHGRH